MAAQLIPPPSQELHNEATHWTDIASKLNIADGSSYEIAGTHLQAIKSLMAKADEVFDPIIKKTHEAHREACGQKKRVVEPLLEAEAVLKRNMGQYLFEQERLRDAEERRLREQAERLAAEAREADIEIAEAEGATVEEIAAISRAPLNVAPVVVPPAAPRMSGISSREVWRAEVTSLHSLVKFAAANPQFLGLLQANSPAIGGMVRSLKSAMHIPGIRVWQETGITARRT